MNTINFVPTMFKESKTLVLLFVVVFSWAYGVPTHADELAAPHCADESALNNGADEECVYPIVVVEDTPTEETTAYESTCEIEGHKYDAVGNPLTDWEIGLIKLRMYDDETVETSILVDTITDEKGYYCLDWDGVSGLEGVAAPYDFIYGVYEILKEGWNLLRIEGGTVEQNESKTLEVVPEEEILSVDDVVIAPVFEANNYLPADTAYHVDFWNYQTGDDSNGGEDPTLACTITSSKNSVTAGEAFTITWTTTLADSVTLNGTPVDLNGSTTIVEGVSESTVYTLIATDVEGENENTTAVECATTVAIASSESSSNGGGGGGGGSGSRKGSKHSNNDSDPDPEGEVLGESTSVLPIGAPDTGAGGTSSTGLASIVAFLGMLMSVVTLRVTKNV